MQPTHPLSGDDNTNADAQRNNARGAGERMNTRKLKFTDMAGEWLWEGDHDGRQYARGKEVVLENDGKTDVYRVVATLDYDAVQIVRVKLRAK